MVGKLTTNRTISWQISSLTEIDVALGEGRYTVLQLGTGGINGISSKVL